MIEKIEKQDVLDVCRETLGLNNSGCSKVDQELLIGLVRRCAGIYCPCSRATLRRSLVEALQYLADSEEVLAERIEAIVEGLVVTGDLLELHDVSTLDPSVKGTWVFAAPPSYVVRPTGDLFVIGIVSDQDVFLPHSLASRMSAQGYARLIAPVPGEDLAARLEEQGLQRLSERSWLRSPKAEEAGRVLEQCLRRLDEAPPAGEVEGLEVLVAERPVTYYRGRWQSCEGKTGTFVGRRPQEYGAPIWCFVQLADGVSQRLVDMPRKRARWRGCDEAWHLQMAIDAERGEPQLYRVHSAGADWRFEFFSPLPAWAERRLITFGRSVQAESCLMAYALPRTAAEVEEQFLQNTLWLSRTEEPG